VTPTLSVDAFQASVTEDDVVKVACTLPGTEGAEASAPELPDEEEDELLLDELLEDDELLELEDEDAPPLELEELELLDDEEEPDELELLDDDELELEDGLMISMVETLSGGNQAFHPGRLTAYSPAKKGLVSVPAIRWTRAVPESPSPVRDMVWLSEERLIATIT
jgi:hypothetical protein